MVKTSGAVESAAKHRITKSSSIKSQHFSLKTAKALHDDHIGCTC